MKYCEEHHHYLHITAGYYRIHYGHLKSSKNPEIWLEGVKGIRKLYHYWQLLLASYSYRPEQNVFFQEWIIWSLISRVDHMISHFKSGSHELSFQEWITWSLTLRSSKESVKWRISANSFVIAWVCVHACACQRKKRSEGGAWKKIRSAWYPLFMHSWLPRFSGELENYCDTSPCCAIESWELLHLPAALFVCVVCPQ